MAIAAWFTFGLIWILLFWFLLLQPLLGRFGIVNNLFDLLDRREMGAGARLRVALSGLKRKLFARLVWLSSMMLSIQAILLPHVTVIEPLIPEPYQKYLLPVMVLTGVIFEVLVKLSPQPVDKINPGVIADATGTPLDVVATVTYDDPVVAFPTQQQAIEASLQETQRKL